MVAFMTNKVPFFSYLSDVLLFDTDQEKCAISELSAKNRVICDTDLINIWILADEACRFTIFSNITS